MPQPIQLPASSIAPIVGPALQRAIEDANRSVLRLYVTAARLGLSEPHAASLLGVDPSFLESVVAEVSGRESSLAACFGFTLVLPRIRDSHTLLAIVREGANGSTSVEALTRSFKLPVVERAMALTREGFQSAGRPDIARICGPTLKRQIEVTNESVLRLYSTAGRLSALDPSTSSLLGVQQSLLDVFAGEAAIEETLLAASYGFPVFESRVHDPKRLISMIRGGSGSALSIAALTGSMSLPTIERATHKERG